MNFENCICVHLECKQEVGKQVPKKEAEACSGLATRMSLKKSNVKTKQRVFFLLFRSRELIQSLLKEFDPSSG